jgi:hypothetical protein
MTKNEALLFFPLKSEDEIIDLYEEYLFEYKTYFLTKYPIEKVFRAKAKKMNQMHEAFILLGGEINTSTTFPYLEYHQKENILECFNYYQKLKINLKSRLNKCNNAIEINNYIYQLIELDKEYAENWSVLKILPENEVIISKEPDPMLILKAIKEFNTLGGNTFNDLNSMKNISPDLLINEAKRLSLYLKIQTIK